MSFSLRRELQKIAEPKVELSQRDAAFIGEVERISKSTHSIETKCGLLSNLGETTDSQDLRNLCKFLSEVVAAQRPELLKNDGAWTYLRVSRDDLDRIEKALKGQPVPDGVLLNKALSRALNERSTN